MQSHRKFWPYRDVPTDTISIYDGPDTFLAEFGAASTGEQVVFAAYWLQAEVLNGGLSQFFSNDTGVLAPEAAIACGTLGLSALAAKLEEAMRWFGNTYPRERETREAALAAYETSHPGETPFDSLDAQVSDLIYDEGPGLEKAAVLFLECNSS